MGWGPLARSLAPIQLGVFEELVVVLPRMDHSVGHRPENVLQGNDVVDADAIILLDLVLGREGRMIGPLHPVHVDDNVGGIPPDLGLHPIQHPPHGGARGQGVGDEGHVTGQEHILLDDIVHAVVGIHTVLSEQGHARGDQQRYLPLVDTHQAVGLDAMLADTLGVELPQTGDLTAHAVVAAVDVVGRDPAVAQGTVLKAEHSVINHKANKPLLVGQGIQTVAEEIVHGDAEVAGDNGKHRDIGDRYVILPLTHGLRRDRKHLGQLGLGDILVLTKGTDLVTDQQSPHLLDHSIEYYTTNGGKHKIFIVQFFSTNRRILKSRPRGEEKGSTQHTNVYYSNIT